MDEARADDDPSAGGEAAPLDRARRHRREWQLVIVVALVVVAALGAWRWWQDRDAGVHSAPPPVAPAATAPPDASAERA